MDQVTDVGAVGFGERHALDEKDVLGIEFGAARKVIRPGDNGVVDDQGFVVHEIVPSGWCVRG